MSGCRLMTLYLRSVLLSFIMVLLGSCVSYEPARQLPAPSLDKASVIERIAVGSCFEPMRGDEIFASIGSLDPDVFMFIGDNVYAESETLDPELKSLRAAYARLADARRFAALRETTPLLVTWDDHDYGLNDAGGDFVHKRKAESLYEHVWDVSSRDPRSKRDGVYYTKVIGPEGRRVQFILLDTRFFRTPLTLSTNAFMGRYQPSPDDDQNMLGEAQWQWFEEQLAKEAELRIIVSSIRLIADGHGWEGWRTMPKERERFYQLLRDTGATGVVLVSGDSHAAAIDRRDTAISYPLYELTASSLNVPLTVFVEDPPLEPDPYRLGDRYVQSNFGTIDIDWESGEVTLAIRDEKGGLLHAIDVNLRELE